MIFFITVLRALAAALITNAHYEGIYPTEIIANGGLIGDTIFFAVSGYCLCNVKQDLSIRGFLFWYGKRLWRVYPPVVICTALYFLIGAYNISGKNAFWWFVYPTRYHFVASIVTLYIPFFFLMKIDMLHRNIGKVMAGIAVLWLLLYFIFFDKGYYHIDSVYEPMIRFLFMESMLLGAWFRINDGKLRNKGKPIYFIGTGFFFVVYFASKIAFGRFVWLSPYQFLNQVAIFALLFFVFRVFCGIDANLEKIPEVIKRIIVFISRMTLEIYVVQYVLIGAVRRKGLVFPANWLVLTASILGSAAVLHTACVFVYKAIDCSLRRLRK